ncbi:phage tail domain-containing protein [Enterococcus sp. DIV0996a]|uniref:phage tail domain-containing protein n=1 Tax=Enterococcus sp. DIV0996a TaxID=2774790 RepID=UPI003F28261E
MRTDCIIFKSENKLSLLETFAPINLSGLRREAPKLVPEYLLFEGENGYRILNKRYDGFLYSTNFVKKLSSYEDSSLFISEFQNLLIDKTPIYLINPNEPGKRYQVIPAIEYSEVNNFYVSGSISFYAYRGYGESLASTQSNFNLEEDWQFSQGLAAEEYQYTHETSRFIIFNGGDFMIDPREHDLTIRIEGESDGEFILFNRTTGDRFIYYPPLHRRYGESLVLESVYPRKNGVSCGIDTNHGVITLAPGENHMELQNISRVKSEWDFRFLYK